MIIFFVGIVISSIVSLNSYKKNPSKKNSNIVCKNYKTTELSTKDIIDPKILDKSSLLRKAFNRVAGFNGRTYKRPITYYIHDETGKKNFRLLPSKTNYTYEISDDAESFIVDIFSKLDNYIDLDFERVNSPRRSIIDIYQTVIKHYFFITICHTFLSAGYNNFRIFQFYCLICCSYTS